MLTRKWNPFNPLTCSAPEALRLMMEKKSCGVMYHTGCSREDKLGRCKGHPIYKLVKE